MSEEKYEEKVLKLLNQLVEQSKPQKSVESFEKHEHEVMPDSAKGHKTIDEVADCPNCRPKLLEKLRPEILKEQREKFKKLKSPKLCEDCGEILDGEQNRDCPNCHGHNY